MMAQIYTLNSAADTHNQAGCPFWNQTLRDVVQDWTTVLGKIDFRSLPPDLQGELQQLELKYAGADAMLPAC
jgi:hypothetical protein